MFVEAGQKKHIMTQEPAGPGNHIRDDLFLGVAEMRLAVDVINRCGDVEPFVHSRRTVGVVNPVGNFSEDKANSSKCKQRKQPQLCRHLLLISSRRVRMCFRSAVNVVGA